MIVLIVRARPRDTEALSSTGATVIPLSDDVAHHLGGGLGAAWRDLNSWVCGSNSALGLLLTRIATTLIYGALTARALAAYTPEVIQVNAINDLVFAYLLNRLRARCRRAIVVGSSQNPAAVGEGFAVGLRSYLIGHLADGFICPSSVYVKQLADHGVCMSRIARIPNAYSSTWLEDLADHTPESVVPEMAVLYVAQISRRKAQHVLLHAAVEVLREHPACQFWFVGGEEDPEYAEELDEIITRNEMSGNIRFFGWIQHTEVASIMKRSTVIAFPSQREMMPRSVIEAMMAGKPVVASRVDGIVDLITHGHTGMLCNQDDSSGFATAIGLLLKYPRWAEQIGSAGRDSVLTQCDPGRVGSTMVSFYEAIMKRDKNVK